MGFNYRKRGKSGTNFSLSSKGPRVSQTMKFGPLTFNVGKTAGQKPVIRTRMNLGNGMFWTKQQTIGAEQRKVNENLSNTFGISDTSESSEISIWIGLLCAIVSFFGPILVMFKVVPYMEGVTGYTLIRDHWGYYAFLWVLIMSSFGLSVVAKTTTENTDGLLDLLPMFFINMLTILPTLIGLLTMLVTILGVMAATVVLLYSLVMWIATT